MTKEGIYEFISRQKTSLISSVDENGYPATRELIQPVLIDGNDIYFATYTSSRKVDHYRNNPKACVYFYEKGRNFQGTNYQILISGGIKWISIQRQMLFFQNSVTVI